MTDLEFLSLAEATLRRVEQACDRVCESSDDDVDARRVGNMLTLVFTNRSEVVINLQKPLHELWLATRLGGYHYRWSGGAWQNTKDAAASTFYEQLQTDVLSQAQVRLPLEA